MKKTSRERKAAALLVLLFPGGLAWAQCNPNGTETLAASVVDLQGQGNFACSQIFGDNGQPMTAVPGFQWSVTTGSPKYMTWSSSQGKQVDKIFVTASGNGSRCLYDFEPGATSGGKLQPAGSASQTTVVACYDTVEVTVPPPPKEPISTVSNCADALPGLQSSLIADGNMSTFIAIGTDQGLGGEGTFDGSYQLAVCSATDQEQCTDQCPTPTSATYTCGTLPAGGKCLTDRRCATSDELPTGNPNAPKYCWELSHQVDVGNGTFIPPTELESGSATWEQYAGSICTKVTTTYAGRQYSYWTPAGCPK